jgi:hypothetical protein
MDGVRPSPSAPLLLDGVPLHAPLRPLAATWSIALHKAHTRYSQ